MNICFNSIKDKYKLPSCEKEDLLDNFEGFINNFEFGMNEQEKESSEILSNLKKAQQIIMESQEVTTEVTTSFKRDSRGKWCRIVGNNPEDLKPIRFKVLRNRPKNGAFQELWNRNYEELVKFKEQYEHTNVTRSNKEYENLGNWVAEQRRKFKRMEKNENGKGGITENQFERLHKLGFEWDRSYYFHNTYQSKQKESQ